MTDAAAAHILVVDDDARLRDLLQRYLVNNGYLVTVAGDAEEAKARLKALAFDLIVLDVMLPGQNGVDFTGELRRDSDLPILLLTARGEPEDRISGLEAGADDYLVKPFEPRELLLRVGTILRRAQANKADEIVRFGPFAFNRANGELRRDDDVVHLTTGEIALLQVLAARPGRAVSRAELGERGGVAGLRPGCRRADGPPAAQDRGRPPPAALAPDRARLGLRAATWELSAMLPPLRRSLNRLAPRTLFGRSLLVVVLPLVILQIVLSIIFYNRHWDTVTRWLASGVAGEVALLAEELEEPPRTRRSRTRSWTGCAGTPISRSPSSPAAPWPRRWRRPASTATRAAGSTPRSSRASRSSCPARSRSTCAASRTIASPSMSSSTTVCCACSPAASG